VKKIVIFGPGDIGELAHFYFRHDSEYEVAAFCADASRIESSTFLGLPVVPFEDIVDTYPPDGYGMFVALAYGRLNRVRAEKYEQARTKGYKLVSYVCSRSVTWPGLSVGDNCFIFENQTIQPFVRIGNNVIMWSGNHIGHHSTIGDHCFITSHVVISGHVEVGPYSFLGVNATVSDGVRLAPSTVVGAGATIVKDTVENGLYVGPRGELRSRDAAGSRYFTHTKYSERK